MELRRLFRSITPGTTMTLTASVHCTWISSSSWLFFLLPGTEFIFTRNWGWWRMISLISFATKHNYRDNKEMVRTSFSLYIYNYLFQLHQITNLNANKMYFFQRFILRSTIKNKKLRKAVKQVIPGCFL